MSSYSGNQLAMLATVATPQVKKTTGGGSFFEAMADAWAQALDRQANNIVEKSDALQAGDDSPSAVTALTTEALKMSFLSNSSHTSISTVGQALETVARKQ
jgi:hypothetical protein